MLQVLHSRSRQVRIGVFAKLPVLHLLIFAENPAETVCLHFPQHPSYTIKLLLHNGRAVDTFSQGDADIPVDVQDILQGGCIQNQKSLREDTHNRTTNEEIIAVIANR